MKLSVCLLCLDEEKNLKRCLDAVKDIAGEIVIGIDDKTTDKTEEIAKKYTKNVFVLKHNDNFHLLKKQVIEKCQSDWILQLDADEVVTPELAKEIKEKLSFNPAENGFWIPRLNYFLGKYLKKGGAYPDPTMRLYRKQFAKLPAIDVHEQAVVVGKIGNLKNYMEHYGDPTFWHYINRFNRYTDLEAKTVTGGLISNLVIKPLIDPRQGFLTIYFRHLGFLDGFPGFVWALFSSLHFPVAYLKHLESKTLNK
jgi:glycosyltransferase involved in cell wall biosynthesis